jgi:hypothetical protein
MNNHPNFIVIPEAAGLAGNVITFGSRPSWAIANLRTREVVEGGFSSRHAAEEYMWKEYSDN